MASVTTGSPAIAVENVAKRYGGRSVVDGVSLEVRTGEVVALLGPNGAGKTTTVEIVEGYRHADGGSVRVLGADPWHAGRAHRARIGLMLQSGGFDMRARPAETLRQYAAFHADAVPPDDLIDELGLGAVARTPYRRLSGGERQRLAFAVALVGRPEVLILDEPTAGMDPEARAVVRARIEAARGEGRAILLTSHELPDVERLADRICILVGGRVVASGSASELGAARTPTLRFTLDRALEPGDVDTLGTRPRRDRHGRSDGWLRGRRRRADPRPRRGARVLVCRDRALDHVGADDRWQPRRHVPRACHGRSR